MPWAPSLERIGTHLGELLKAAEAYREEIGDLFREATESGRHTERTLKVWSWQVDAAGDFCDQLERDVHDLFMRIAEQDYVLRRDDADDVLV